MFGYDNFVQQFANKNGMGYKQSYKQARPYYDAYKKQHYTKMAEDILGYGGEEAQKGALAALLSGLDAQIKIN